MRQRERILSKALATVVSLACLAPAGPARADRLPGSAETAAFLHVYADKGLECGLLQPWEALVLKLQVRQERRDWTAQQRQGAAEEIARRVATTACDDSAMNGWITGSRPGFEAEMLPPYLVMYHALAREAEPPTPFDLATVRLDYREAIRRIEDKFAQLEAAGRNPEGAQTWPGYRARLEEFIDEAVAAYETGGQLTSKKSIEALTFMSTAGMVVEAWLKAPGE